MFSADYSLVTDDKSVLIYFLQNGQESWILWK